MHKLYCLIVVLLFGVLPFNTVFSQNLDKSVAQKWSEATLFAVRNDFARPTIHARNLFHVSVSMFDAWAAYEPNVEPYMLGNVTNGFSIPFDGVVNYTNDSHRLIKQKEAISYAAYRLLKHRYSNAPGVTPIYNYLDSLMSSFGYDINITSTDYIIDGAPAVGNYIAEQIIEYGLQDGTNEVNGYEYQYYTPANDPIEVEEPGNPSMVDPNRWQAISLSQSIDQSGNLVAQAPKHLGPEWGDALPFSLKEEDQSLYNRDNHTYKVYFDPGTPPYLDTVNPTEMEDFFKWNFVMVSIWQSHLDPSDTTMWDISPNSIGNVSFYPENWSDYELFYDLYDGGDASDGYALNPITGQPYEVQNVKRADYARVLAEFWADGIDSETPPGHWFDIYNHIRLHELFENKWKGEGDTISNLEMDLKSYLAIGGGMHDAAIAAWSVKGWYDYPRPVSMIRYMADKGQSSDPMLPNYHPGGLPLIPDYVELVTSGDTLAGVNDEHLNKIKLYTWKGPDYINDPEEDTAGVGWILAENWWPYQRPSFVTPPFAGYVSGHSTFSRAAANIFTFITGSEYFPGGISDFVAVKNDYLEFEVGPSDTIKLQWATYRDASDQCSLSRIWGGIHPSIDDIPGRKIGEAVGNNVNPYADSVVSIKKAIAVNINANILNVNVNDIGQTLTLNIEYDSVMNTAINPNISFPIDNPTIQSLSFINGTWLTPNVYEVNYSIENYENELSNIYIKIDSAESISNLLQKTSLFEPIFSIDTKSPEVDSIDVNLPIINSLNDNDHLIVDFYFSEDCQNSTPQFDLIPSSSPDFDLNFNSVLSQWMSADHYKAYWDISLVNPTVDTVSIEINNALDISGNNVIPYSTEIIIDNTLPEITLTNSSKDYLNIYDFGSNTYAVEVDFNKAMNQDSIPTLELMNNNILVEPLELNYISSEWIDSSSLILLYDLPFTSVVEYYDISLSINNTYDHSLNYVSTFPITPSLAIDSKRPSIDSLTLSHLLINESVVANESFYVDAHYSEVMNLNYSPVLYILSNGLPLQSVTFNPFESYWLSPTIYRAKFSFPNGSLNENSLSIQVESGIDSLFNPQNTYESDTVLSISYQDNDLGLGENQEGAFTLYPNPVNKGNSITVRLKNNSKTILGYKIADSKGSIVAKNATIQNSNEISIPIDKLSSGQFTIYIHSEESTLRDKFIVYD